MAGTTRTAQFNKKIQGLGNRGAGWWNKAHAGFDDMMSSKIVKQGLSSSYAPYARAGLLGLGAYGAARATYNSFTDPYRSTLGNMFAGGGMLAGGYMGAMWGKSAMAGKLLGKGLAPMVAGGILGSLGSGMIDNTAANHPGLTAVGVGAVGLGLYGISKNPALKKGLMGEVNAFRRAARGLR